MENILDPSERETHISMAGDDHSQWLVFSDDPYWQRRLDRIAVGAPVGAGKMYVLRAEQVLLRKGKRTVSEAQRAAMTERAKFMRKSTNGVQEEQQQPAITAVLPSST